MFDEHALERIREGMPEIVAKLYGITDLRRSFRCLSREHEDSTPSCHYYPSSCSAYCLRSAKTQTSFSSR